MRWGAVVPAWLSMIEGDSVVQSVIGDTSPRLYMIGERDFEIDSIEWCLLSDLEGEIYEDALLQLDLWCETMAKLVTLAGAVRRLAHRDLPFTTGGHELWSMLTGARRLEGPRDGHVNLSMDFRLQYLRSRYVA